MAKMKTSMVYKSIKIQMVNEVRVDSRKNSFSGIEGVLLQEMDSELSNKSIHESIIYSQREKLREC